MRRLCALVVLPVVALAARTDQLRMDHVSAASAFIDTLDKDQHHRAVLPFDGDYRTYWRYTPAVRQGVSWKEFDARQTKAAETLIKSALSEMGFKRTQDVRTLEAALGQIEGSASRDKDNYLFTFFGTPSNEGKWGWRYEGHHVSLNFTYQGRTLVASTPQFFGSNPADVPSGAHKGMRLLAKEEDLGIALFASLTDPQRKTALLAERAPNEIFTAENRTAAPQQGGISYADMTRDQRQAMQALVRAIAEVQEATEVARRLSAIEKAGWEKVVFAWMGAPDRSAAHYYRVQGPTFIIEFDNTQNRANHIHLVWRDFEGDFGRDVLKEHYEQHALDHAHGHDH